MNLANSKPHSADPGAHFFAWNLTHRHKLALRAAAGGLVLLAGVAAAAQFQTSGTADSAVSTTAASATTAAGLPVEVVPLEAVSSFQQHRTFTGSIVAGRSSQLSFQRSDKVIVIMVEEGDPVHAGQALAQLDTRRLEVQLRQLTAECNQAAARLDELIAGPRKETIDASKADVRALAAQLQLEQLNLDRKRQLRSRNVISQEEFDEASFGVQALKAQLDSAQQKLDELLAGTRKEQVAAQQAVVEQLNAAIADVEIEIQDSTIHAPFAGQVGKRYVDEGTIVAAQTPVLKVVEQSNREAWIGVPPETAAALQIGTQYEVQVGPRRLQARLTSVSPELESRTRTRNLIFTLAETPDVAMPAPGEIARVAIDQTVEASGFWLPSTSLVRGTRGLWSVFVVVDGDRGGKQLSKRDVELLYTDDYRVLVRGMLQPGEEVVAGGVHRIVDGQPVQVAGSVSVDEVAADFQQQ